MSVQDETPSQCNRFEEAAVIQSSPTLAGLERRFTIREVEHLARISHATAYDRIRRGLLRVVKDGRLAKHMKVTLSAVQRARDSGRVTVNAEGGIDDLDAARQEWLSRSEARGNSPVASRPAGGSARPQRKAHRGAQGKATPPPGAASLIGRRLALVVPASGDPADLDAASAVLLERSAEAEREIAAVLGGTDIWLLGDDRQRLELLDTINDGLVIIRELALHGVES